MKYEVKLPQLIWSDDWCAKMQVSTNLISIPILAMNSDQDNQRLPVKLSASDVQIQPATAAQAVMGHLPGTDSIKSDEKIQIAREEGYDPMAIDLALAPPGATIADKIRLLILIIVAAVLVIFFFPLNRFFKPAPRDLGSMSIGGPILEASLKASDFRHKPWLKALVKIDRLYFQEGKLSEAIQLAELELEQVPLKDRENWQKLFYRYWELLIDADRVHVLKISTRAYLNAYPEDPFTNYYFARAFLKAADRNHSFTPETKNAYRQEAEIIARQLDRTCSTLFAQKKHPDVSKVKLQGIRDLYQKLRLEQAKLFVLIWKLGSYEEDDHPDVVYRDKALDICESEELADMKEAKALMSVIYTHILDRWNWFEGQQIIQGQLQKRKNFQKQLDALNTELREAEE
ncbi:hypothetical protein D1BOALGB6SA_6994 [Olavius sp. associated proteobacterium Delta 1]|nr:hypothetical protein D1BOALGB6SA_6994 [Olavius sp. associated proteobacterium Delta 1]